MKNANRCVISVSHGLPEQNTNRNVSHKCHLFLKKYSENNYKSVQGEESAETPPT